MPIDPVKIPQNVYIEDRIVGPLTLKQTLIMAGGGGFSYALYGSLSKAYGSLSLPIVILVWIPFVICMVFALVKINDLSLAKICLLLLERFHKPTVRTWAPRRGISINIRTQVLKEDNEKLVRHQQEVAKGAETKEKIKQLSSLLDQKEEHMQADEPMAASDEVDDLVFSEEEPADQRPVDPKRISVDHPQGEPPGGEGLSDLSLFRDIFPKT